MKQQAGKLFVVGLGPGPEHWIVPEAQEALKLATDIIGYGPYVARIRPHRGQTIHATDNRVEIDRARHALELTQAGKTVAVVSGGDPGVFAMAAAVLEAIEQGPEIWRSLDLQVVPGITAMQAAAARLGAPLGHDFCAISLSDNLKPWTIIEKRLIAAAHGDFVIALYNPASKARPLRIFEAFALLNTLKDNETPVAFARAVGREDEKIHLTTLANADLHLVDMSTLVLIGSSETRFVSRPNGASWLLTPRSYKGAE
jgi:precorrin-3B C17-methyltransferase